MAPGKGNRLCWLMMVTMVRACGRGFLALLGGPGLRVSFDLSLLAVAAVAVVACYAAAAAAPRIAPRWQAMK